MNQLFIIPADTWERLDQEEVVATADAMRELGIFHLPYPKVDIWLPASRAISWTREEISADPAMQKLIDYRVDHELYYVDGDRYYCHKGSGFVFQFSNISLDPTITPRVCIHVEPGSPAAKFYKPGATTLPNEDNTPALADRLATPLIVLLATRNSVKTTREYKCAKLGIGKRRHQYVTTITIPHEREDHEASTPGASKCAHLRRGHIRRQHYGPHYMLTKQIWIEPVFVNADDKWVQQRERYNVSL
jgi:hypothetical protein